LPERKPARALPTRKTIMLVLHDGAGRILLERRPPTGVWPQLWSLPEADNVRGARRRLPARTAFRSLPAFTHTFSHFRLEVAPLQAHLGPESHIADAPHRRWLQPRAAARLGLPAPVRKLIQSVAEEI
jgi:A/G-specific adenine glycosylase